MAEQLNMDTLLAEGKKYQQEFDEWKETRGARFLLREGYRIASVFAARYLRTGKKVSIRLIWELMRDRLDELRGRAERRGIAIKKYGGFVLNDHYHAYFSLHMEDRRPDWKGMFRHRELGPSRKQTVIVIPGR